MKRQRSLVITLALLSVTTSAVMAKQGGGYTPPPANLGQQIKAYQDRLFKEEYGFSDKQIAEYHKKDSAIIAACEKKTEALRKQVAKSPAPKKRELYTQIRALERQKQKDRDASLLAIANPTQQAKIKAQMAKQQAQ